MEERHIARYLVPAADYIGSIPKSEQVVIFAHVEHMRSGDFKSVRTKQLRGPIRELIVGHHRLTYFQIDSTMYFVRGFRKKSAKTPTSEIEYAEKVYRIMKGYK